MHPAIVRYARKAHNDANAMTTQRLRRRFFRNLAALALTGLLAACVSDGDDDGSLPPADTPGGVRLQIVSFGDSLSDVGTYAPFANTLGGGRFTTNPGQVWTQRVATYYGDTLVAAQTGGYSVPVVNNPNGYGYAQGGALVSGTQGNNWAPNGTAALTVPVATQFQNYLSAHGNFRNDQLVLIQGGPNDVIQAANSVAANPTDLTAPAAATTAVQSAGVALARAAQNAIRNGARHVVVVNSPNLAETPLTILSVSPTATGALFNSLVQAFNTALATQLTNDGTMRQVVYIDAAAWFHDTLASYQSQGFTVSNTATACNLAAMALRPPPAFQSNPLGYATSLFCSPANFTVAGADQTYMFADLVHPTTHLHALFAQNVQRAIAASGLGR
ncbi:phospholipase/lecithinase/hemolysin [Cupriavidus plantarum]|nr:phospholipase/lecithinase/hemolysin [Cupriavidus plantarum]